MTAQALTLVPEFLEVIRYNVLVNVDVANEHRAKKMRWKARRGGIECVIAREIPVSQIQYTMPEEHARLITNGRERFDLMVVHGDEFGNITGSGLSYLNQHEPDIVVCCFPKQARRNNPRWRIYGWENRTMRITVYVDSTAITIQASGRGEVI